ncbi:type 2 glycerol-3-phosphate oxidase [Spiroplasma turonicum]|uniref:Glycerol-3-phosphate oxidase n=1 Tax=Spiroplasma turonicum TaxID=216946 RepID=A0A0K1P664_9MOLU|nr:type 2 glycerol-3-phosphate oxidase [Spiroplasma turonicum]AKU79791.1 glycerol-3-phosphate oxidase [Spiroplasma turonicum]ALX70809.1 glycerol-3-phosphate oxidase [Spiroplasma turonicum]
MNNYDICIIGAGIIGASIARELSKYNKKILLLEANARVAMETTAGNSGLVHGGFDPTPGKLNAKLNILGKKRYEDWINEMEFPYLRINSTVVAFNETEFEDLKMLYKRGLENGLSIDELELLNHKEILDREPNLSQEVIAALVCNSSIAVDSVELTKTLIRNSIKNGVNLKLNSKVIEITKNDEEFIIKTSKIEEFKSKVIINAAGHYADVISSMAGHDDFKLTTRRGEYRILEKTERGIVNSVIFMVPTIHGKGVIVAPMLDGHIMVGPTSEENVSKEETRLVTKNKFDEIGKIGKKLVPSLNIDKTSMTYSGSRPIESTTDDFWIKPSHSDCCFINVAGMKSPAIASAPAIADYVIELVKNAIGEMEMNKNYNPIEKSIIPII